MTKIKESFSMQSFVFTVSVLKKVHVGDKVVGSATPLIYKLFDIAMREINRAATVNNSFLDAETKTVFSKECKTRNKISHSCLGFRIMLDMIGDCPEKHVWEWLFLFPMERSQWIIIFFFRRGGNSNKYVSTAILT